MSIETDLRAHLLDDADVAALVSTRIYPTKAPPKSLDTGYPLVTYFVVSQPRDHTHDKVDGLRFTRIQLNCWAKGNGAYAGAKALAAAVAGALDNFQGDMGDGPTSVKACFVEDAADILDPALAVGTDVPQGVRVDVRIIHAP